MVTVATEDAAGDVQVNAELFTEFRFLKCILTAYLCLVRSRVVTKIPPTFSRPGPKLESRIQLLEPAIQPELWLWTARLWI